MLCHITGTLYKPDGTAYAGAFVNITSVPREIESAYLGAVVPRILTVRTDGNGNVDFSLISGEYIVSTSVRRGDGGFANFTRFNVPELPSAQFSDCIDAATPVIIPGWLGQAIQARDEAEAARDAAQAAAAEASVIVADLIEDFETREDFAAWVGAGNVPSIGAVVNAGGYAYRYVGAPYAVLPGLGGWTPDGDWHVRHFGVTGATSASVPNETTAMQAAIDATSAARVPLHMEDTVVGVQRLLLPDAYHVLIGNSRQGDFTTWFNDQGNKPLLRPGYKQTMSGSNILLIGGASHLVETRRTDKFGSFTTGILGVNFTSPYRWEGINVVQNMDVYTAAGVLTTSANDNAATGYDVGVCIRGQHHNFDRCTVFGYWAKGLSFVVHSSDTVNTIDSDYVRGRDCTFTGLALIGANVLEYGINGLTGSQWIDCQFFSAGDHHTTASGRYSAGECPILFVDGILTNGGGIRGHYFHGSYRSRSNVVGQLGSCTQCSFYGVSEFPEVGTDPNTNQAGGFERIAGTTARDIGVFTFAAGNGGNGGFSRMWAGNLAQANVIGGGVPAQGFGLQNYYDGKVIRILHNETNGNAVINFSPITASSLNTGWNLQREYTASQFTVRFDNSARLVMPDDAAGIMRIAYTGGLRIGGSSGPVIRPIGAGATVVFAGPYANDAAAAAAGVAIGETYRTAGGDHAWRQV